MRIRFVAIVPSLRTTVAENALSDLPQNGLSFI